MRIELANLEDGRGEFATTYEADQLALEDERVQLAGPINVRGRIKRAGAEIVVSGHIEGKLSVDCDRCLKELDLPLNTDFTIEYVSGSDYESSQAAELTEDEMAVSVFDGVGIDLDEIVKEQILLAVPTRLLCSVECKGICPVCGADKNTVNCSCESPTTDPRWDALRSLKRT
jgi:uncharacterized protein